MGAARRCERGVSVREGPCRPASTLGGILPRIYIPEANALVPLDSIADKSYADIEISRDSNPRSAT